MHAPAHEIVPVPHDSPARQVLYDQCIQVRIKVFVHEQKFPLETEVDEDDATATHFLLRLVPSGTAIGTIRMLKPPGASYYKLTRLVVLKEYRKYHLGAKLVHRGHQWAIENDKSSRQCGTVDIVVHSQMPVKAFYAKFGYLPEGDEFDEEGAPHQKMVLRLRHAQTQ